MTSRRIFLRSLAALPSALWLPAASQAAASVARQALIIGNSRYRHSPLLNPANDARAIARLLGQAGFTVNTHLDANRVDMLAAIERFGAAACAPETRLAVFYYAGHGVQLDWRNYLIPADADVAAQAHIAQRCVDLATVLGQLGTASDRTRVVILDACRNNPFGDSYRPAQQGLSQFDAPAGSLLAYATAPGSVAFDGEGANGLYTENLLRELAPQGTRIEDAFKRVRLNVRLASNGDQIPWETTSLESDVFIFNNGQHKLSEEELEKLIEADIAAWQRIQASRQVDDWVAYLRRFPNGRFAEIAEMRLNRLVAQAEKRPVPAPLATAPAASSAAPGKITAVTVAPAPVPASAAPPATPAQAAARPAMAPAKMSAAPPAAPRPPPTAPTTDPARPADIAAEPFALDIQAGKPIPPLFAASPNPFSSGRYALNRRYAVGDQATIRLSDSLTGVETRSFTQLVTHVDVDADRVEYNNGSALGDLMGNMVKAGGVEFDTPVQFAPAELQIGRKWTAAFRRTKHDDSSTAYYDLHVASREEITVPAGRFDTFRIDGRGWNTTKGNRLEVRLWLVPGLNFPVKREVLTRNARGRIVVSERYELVALRQHYHSPA